MFVALTSAFQGVAAYLAGTQAALSPVQVCPSHKNSYHLLYTSYVLGILNVLLLIRMAVLNRKWHATNFTEEDTPTLKSKVLPTMAEPLDVRTGIESPASLPHYNKVYAVVGKGRKKYVGASIRQSPQAK